MRKEYAPEDIDLVATTDAHGRADKVTEPIYSAHRRLVKRRDEERARLMRQVMLDPVSPLTNLA